jgi:hypothetical protein
MSDDSDSEMGSLFKQIDVRDSIFVFENIQIIEINSIEFTYRVNDIIFHSLLVIPGTLPLQRLPTELQHRILFSIGMCVLPWYWMGFATKIIKIHSNLGTFTSTVIEFWSEFYNEILLEYMYLNHLDFDIEITYTSCSHSTSEPIDTSSITANSSNKVLIPIGGKPISHLCTYLLHFICMINM